MIIKNEMLIDNRLFRCIAKSGSLGVQSHCRVNQLLETGI
jgi:hypothetical protein